MKVELKALDVYKQALKSFDAGVLQAQKPDQSRGWYAGPCAIGVSLTSEQQEYFDSPLRPGYNVESVISRGDIVTDDAHALSVLQQMHDRLLACRKNMEFYYEQVDIFRSMITKYIEKNG